MVNPKPDPFCNPSEMGLEEIIGASKRNNFVVKLPYGVLKEGHVLLIPRAHMTTMGDMPEDMIGEYTELANRLIGTLEDTYRVSPVVFEHGERGQTIPHAHEIYVPLVSECPVHGKFCVQDLHTEVRDIITRLDGHVLEYSGGDRSTTDFAHKRLFVRKGGRDIRPYLALRTFEKDGLYVPDDHPEFTSIFRKIIAEHVPRVTLEGYTGNGNPLNDWQAIKDLPAAKARDQELREKTRKALKGKL